MRLNFLIRFLTTSRLTKGVTIVASTNNAAGAGRSLAPARALSLSLSPTLSLRKPHNTKLRLLLASLQTLRATPNPNCGIRVFFYLDQICFHPLSSTLLNSSSHLRNLFSWNWTSCAKPQGTYHFQLYAQYICFAFPNQLVKR
jgi:hypothetical protein